MSLSSCRLSGFIVAALYVLGFVNPSIPTRAETHEHNSLAGQLLIASPLMTSPAFSGTVIVIVRDEKEGAMGVVINRPIGDRPLASLLQASGEKVTADLGNVRVYSGGPVEPGVGFVIHTNDYQGRPTIRIDEKIALTSSPDILRDIGKHHGPQKSRIAFGYAGWGPGQLAAELEQGFWFTTPEDPSLVFDENPDAVWEQAMKRRTQDL